MTIWRRRRFVKERTNRSWGEFFVQSRLRKNVCRSVNWNNNWQFDFGYFSSPLFSCFTFTFTFTFTHTLSRSLSLALSLSLFRCLLVSLSLSISPSFPRSFASLSERKGREGKGEGGRIPKVWNRDDDDGFPVCVPSINQYTFWLDLTPLSELKWAGVLGV